MDGGEVRGVPTTAGSREDWPPRTVDDVAEEIVLRMDRASAEDLAAVLYDLGEHIAAGAPITPLTTDEDQRLSVVMRDLDHALGRRCSPYFDHLRDSNG